MAPQVPELVPRKPEHEVRWKPRGVPFDRPHGGFGLDAIQGGKVSVEHRSATAHDDDPRFDGFSLQGKGHGIQPPAAAYPATMPGEVQGDSRIGPRAQGARGDTHDAARVVRYPCC